MSKWGWTLIGADISKYQQTNDKGRNIKNTCSILNCLAWVMFWQEVQVKFSVSEKVNSLCPAFHGSSFMLVFYKCLSQTFVENKLCDMKYGPGPPPQGPSTHCTFITSKLKPNISNVRSGLHWIVCLDCRWPSILPTSLGTYPCQSVSEWVGQWLIVSDWR